MSKFQKNSVQITSLEDLKLFAKKIAVDFKPGDVIALDGPLGAGKTTFVQFLTQALNIDVPVTSPTFTLIHDYPWQKDSHFYHLDCYRLRRIDEVLNIGLTELIDERKHLVVIEWPGVAKPLLPAYTLWFSFKMLNHNAREITYMTLQTMEYDTFH